jgi:DNA-binding transcriptional LysR family regulator
MLLRAIPDFQERHPEIQLILVSINDRAEIGDEGVGILIRPRSKRQSGVEHRPTISSRQELPACHPI